MPYVVHKLRFYLFFFLQERPILEQTLSVVSFITNSFVLY